jgi:hypothetical protein
VPLQALPPQKSTDLLASSWSFLGDVGLLLNDAPLAALALF